MEPVYRMVICLGLLLVGVSSAWASSNKLVILGDSISAGYGMASDQGWVALFAKRLGEAGIDTAVVNESISGEITAGGLARLPVILEKHQPAWLVIELGGNDGLRGLSPKVMQSNLQQMVALAKAANTNAVLFGMKLPPNYGQAYNRLFENAFVRAAEVEGIPLLPFFLEGVGGFDELMQEDRVHPNAEAQQQLMENAWGFLLPLLKQK